LYGLTAGARGYFSKSPGDLSVAEAATLAGIVRSPYRYSPLENPVPALERRNLVLEQMRAFKFITDKEFAAAVRAPLLQ
jgi:penicillin-binding protein 1A